MNRDKSKSKKKRKYLRRLGTAAVLLFVFLSVLLIESAKWLKIVYGDIEFSTVVYQMLSPLKGTEHGIVYQYITECVPPVLLWTCILVTTIILNNCILSRLSLKCTVSFGAGHKLRIQSKKPLYPCVVIVVLLIVLYTEADKVGCIDFLKDTASKSTLYEDEYISPDDIEILFPEEKRNMILIYIESMESTFADTDAGGGKAVDYMPELTRLAEDNLYFSNSDKLGGALQCEGTDWTMSGILASSTGVNYKLPITRNTEKEYESLWPGLKGIGNILAEAGYNNYYMCGSNADFAGKRTYLMSHGNYEIFDRRVAIKEGIISEDYYVFWGMEDFYTFDWAKQKLAVLGAEEEPFNFTMLTVDTHFPEGYICELCDNKYPEQYGNVIACSSKQVAEFVEWIQAQPWYENTTVILLGDHISMNETFYDDIGDYERTIYNCFINVPKEPDTEHTKYRQYSTMDYCPTILASLGIEIEGNRLGLGTNLFSGEDTLIEKLGYEQFNAELKKSSMYYLLKFCVASDD